MDTNYNLMSFKSFQSLMFKWLFKGVACTAITSIIILMSGILNLLSIAFIPLLIICSIIEIAMVIILAKKLENLDLNKAKFYFYLYSMINGITLSFLLSAIHPMIAVIVFVITSAYFGLLHSITGFIKSDCTTLGHMCISALPILIISYIILFFIQLPVMYYAVVLIDLVVFSGLTIYDMKKAKKLYEESDIYNVEGNALLCALELYLDFINIFIDIVMLVADN